MRYLILSLVLATAATTHAAPGQGPSVAETPFGKTADGTPVTAYTLMNKNGIEVTILTYGGTVQKFTAPDKTGTFADIVLGFDSIEGYQSKGNPYFGCLVGRVANRVANATFALDGKTYTITGGNPHSLHGGTIGFDKKVWKGSGQMTDQGPAVTLRYTSKNMEEGFPGELQCEVVYTLLADNALQIDYLATTNKTTIVNLTNHSYFNLGGQASGTILDQVLKLAATEYTPGDEKLLPTGEIKSVTGTVFDFTTPTAIGKRIQEVGGTPVGYDLNMVHGRSVVDSPREVAMVTDPKSGRTLTMSTTMPGVQFYTGNFLDGTVKGKSGTVYNQYSGFCLEAQLFPDAVNRPNFPSPVIQPGQEYRQRTLYKVGVSK